jgi:hypothetical protein
MVNVIDMLIKLNLSYPLIWHIQTFMVLRQK